MTNKIFQFFFHSMDLSWQLGISVLVYLLYEVTINGTFQNFCREARLETRCVWHYYGNLKIVVDLDCIRGRQAFILFPFYKSGLFHLTPILKKSLSIGAPACSSSFLLAFTLCLSLLLPPSPPLNFFLLRFLFPVALLLSLIKRHLFEGSTYANLGVAYYFSKAITYHTLAVAQEVDYWAGRKARRTGTSATSMIRWGTK